ncbi:MAG: hypothetical protein R3C15_04065 [Thermoleophilia bacterium]
MRRLLLTALVAVVALVAAGQAAARVVVRQDDDGRAITFDVRAGGVDVEWYADLLRGAAHGDEIEDVRIRIAPWSRIAALCGSNEAAGCYGGVPAGIVVPAGKGAEIAHTLLHEYGHHVDATIHHGRLAEPNGTPTWWKARGMAQFVRQGRVARNYRLGWEHAIGEIFAEDYARLHMRTVYGIGWLSPPGARILTALRQDLGFAAAEPMTPAELGPLVITRKGTIGSGERRVLPFGLLGPGRHVTFDVRLAGDELAGARARIDLVCDGQPIANEDLSEGETRATIDLRDLGPASCEVSLLSLTGEPLDYTAVLRLAVQA